MSHQKLNLNAYNKLLGSLGDVVDRIVLPRCYIPIALQVRFPYWIFKVHLKLHLGYYSICSYRSPSPSPSPSFITCRPWSRFCMEVAKVVFSPLL